MTPEETSPSESPSPSDEAAASSRGSSAASPFIADPGPTFDPGAESEPEPSPGPDEGATLHALPEPPPEWEEETVRRILTAKGAVLHGIVGVAERDWAYTDADLAAIAPPLTNILNRYPATRAAAGTGDELALMIGVGGYVGRSYVERKAALAELAEELEVPITGRGPAVVHDQEPAEAGEEEAWTRPSSPPIE